jgi:hypothetical protein
MGWSRVSQEKAPFKEVLHEMLAIIANALADSPVPQQDPVHQAISHLRHFSLPEFISERGEDLITATIGFT